MSPAQPDAAAANIAHFDHNYDCILLDYTAEALPEPLPTTNPPDLVKQLGEGRLVELVLRRDMFELHEQTGTTLADMKKRQLVALNYSRVRMLEWDHSASAAKFYTTYGEADGTSIIVKVVNSLELESELQLRFKGLIRQCRMQGLTPPKVPAFAYVGMYAGATKPKPFQRKRASLSHQKQGKLPPLSTMRDIALARHHGSGAPVPTALSKRVALAFEHVYKGTNSFVVVQYHERSAGASGGGSGGGMLSAESKLVVDAGGVRFYEGERERLSVTYEDIRTWNVIDNMHTGDYSNGLELEWFDGTQRKFFFVVLEVRLLQHALEFFWNRIQSAAGREAKAKSTHGRHVIHISTLLGEEPPKPSLDGDLVITDSVGKSVKSGAAKRRSSMGFTRAADAPVNGDVARHWPEVCRHQGWLLKKGGIAKNWMKRYAVLYSTCQGHFLCYYSDYADCPLYCKEQKERNVIDLCKTTFIRPITSAKDAPPNSFDICTIEREWTLSADSKDNMQRWLQIITQTIDEDVPIVPDDELIFMVKPRNDPSGQLVRNEYSTMLKVSASGVAVSSTAGSEAEESEKFFWCYTDFFKWSVLHHNGKQALSVSVFASGDFDSKARQEFLFRTREAQKLATAIEFYIEKFMAIMNLQLEGEDDAAGGKGSGAGARDAGDDGAAAGEAVDGLALATDEEFAQEMSEKDLLVAFDDDDEPSSVRSARV